MQIAQILAGYSLGEADLLRRAMGKKKKEEMDPQQARFVSGAAERGRARGAVRQRSSTWWPSSPATASTRATPRAYALIAYQTGWLKANAPVEFFAASMSLDIVQHRQAGGLLPGRQALRRDDPRRPTSTAPAPTSRSRTARCSMRWAPSATSACEAMEHVVAGARGGRAVPRPVRLRRAGRPQAGQQARAGEPGPGRAPSTASTPTAPRSSPPPTC